MRNSDLSEIPCTFYPINGYARVSYAKTVCSTMHYRPLKFDQSFFFHQPTYLNNYEMFFYKIKQVCLKISKLKSYLIGP